jgi:phosphoenolpyruvate carboxylase
MKSNFHNINLGLDKEQLNRKVPYSIINKKKSAEIGSLLHKKNLDNKEKEIVKKYFTRSKHKNKDNKHKDKDKIIKNSDIATHKKKIKEKETLAEENENENKVNTENNNIETIKTKKQSKIKKFLCCIINDNCDSSIEKK